MNLAISHFVILLRIKVYFRPGATNIAIYNKQGELVGTLEKAAMPDFSSVNSGSGVATLINPQYIASVKHNGGYTNVSFGYGESRYNIVDRNNAPSLDFHAPRLDKLVTEVAPAAVTAQGQWLAHIWIRNVILFLSSWLRNPVY